MSALVWDKIEDRHIENGVSHGVLFSKKGESAKMTGVVWNGLTSVSDSPDGAEANDIYADNIKFASMRSAENAKGTIEALMYPDEFAECDGSYAIAPGVTIGQQPRKSFAFSYTTNISSSTEANIGYKLHIVYGCTASPSEKTHETVNDSPDADTFSWEYDTVPIALKDGKVTATLEIDSTKVAPEKMKLITDKLWGSETGESELLTPDEIMELLAG